MEGVKNLPGPCLLSDGAYIPAKNGRDLCAAPRSLRSSLRADRAELSLSREGEKAAAPQSTGRASNDSALFAFRDDLDSVRIEILESFVADRLHALAPRLAQGLLARKKCSRTIGQAYLVLAMRQFVCV